MMKENNKPELFSKEYQKQWSETHKYKHIHTGEHCTFEAYVAEYLVLRWTEAFKMDKPSYKFWTSGDRYHSVFMSNMKAAYALKKKFPERIILGAIKSSHFEKIFFVGLRCSNPKGWKYNKVAVEAIKSYHKEENDLEQTKKIQKQADNNIPEQEKQHIVRRQNQMKNNKSALNKLRNQ